MPTPEEMEGAFAAAGKIEELTAERDAALTRLDATNTQVDELGRHAEHLRAELTERAVAIDDMGRRMGQLTEENENLKAEVKDLEVGIEDVDTHGQTRRRELLDQLELANATIEDLRAGRAEALSSNITSGGSEMGETRYAGEADPLAEAKARVTECKRECHRAEKALVAFDQAAMTATDDGELPRAVVDGESRRGLIRAVNESGDAHQEAKTQLRAAEEAALRAAAP